MFKALLPIRVVCALAVLSFSLTGLAQTTATPKPTTLVQELMEQLYSSLGAVAISKIHVNFSIKKDGPNSEPKMVIKDIEFASSIQFSKSISATILKNVNQKELVPELTIDLKDLILDISLLNNEANETESLLKIATTRKVKDKYEPAPIRITLNNQGGSILDLRLAGLEMVIDGLRKQSPAIQFRANCILKENLADIATRKVVMKNAQCIFDGYFNSAEGKWEYNFCTDSDAAAGRCSMNRSASNP